MTQVVAGQSVTLVALLYDEPGGTLIDADAALTVTIDPLTGGGAVVSSATSVHAATGRYTYEWTPAADLDAGDYLAAWAGLVDGVAVDMTEVVTVVAPADAAWCSVADVALWTGETVTEAQVFQASGVIDLFANRTGAVLDVLSERDKRWLRQATAYQAAWQANQPGFMSRLASLLDFNQDGLSGKRPDLAATVLAPLARRALVNCSWKGAGTLAFGPTVQQAVRDFRNEESDGVHQWGALR